MSSNNGFIQSGSGLFAAGVVGMFLLLWVVGPRATPPKTFPPLSSQPAASPPAPAPTTEAVPAEPRREKTFANAVGEPWAAPRERITSLYHCLLEREPDERGLEENTKYWGNAPHTAGVNTFFQFDEYKNKRKNNSEFVRDLYQALLGREPVADELRSGVNYLDAHNGDRRLLFNVFTTGH